LDKASNELHDKDDIIALFQRISYIIYAEVEDEKLRNDKRNNQNHSRKNQLSNKEKEKQDSAPRRKHDGAHQWKDCPENWHNKNRCNTSYGILTASNTLSTQNKSSKGKVRSTENEESQSKDHTPIVRFEDIESDIESEESSVTS
jgi:hypothetical protein